MFDVLAVSPFPIFRSAIASVDNQTTGPLAQHCLPMPLLISKTIALLQSEEAVQPHHDLFRNANTLNKRFPLCGSSFLSIPKIPDQAAKIAGDRPLSLTSLT